MFEADHAKGIPMTSGTRAILLNEISKELVGKGSGDTKILSVNLEQVEDLLEQSAWRVTLFLPKPETSQWPVEETRSIKRLAREVTDNAASQLNSALEGITSVVLTTDQAPAEDTAPPEVAELNETEATKSEDDE
jgi:hypothetical protein